MDLYKDVFIESENTKTEVCNSCVRDLEEVFTEEQILDFKKAFQEASKGYILKKNV